MLSKSVRTWKLLHLEYLFKYVIHLFYCVNTSYPMDNCFTGRRDRSRQTPEKGVLYILPARPVTESAFARWRIVFPSCLDIIASFLFGAWSVQTCFLQRDVFEGYQQIYPFYELLCSTTTRSVPDVGIRGWETIHVSRNLNARFARASLLLKFNSWPPLPTNSGKNVESRRRQRQKLPVVLPLLSRKPSSKPTSEDIKSLDDKWSETFSQLESLLLSKSFAVLVEPVKPSTVVTREHPFFDPGASSSVVSSGLVTEGTSPSLVQTTGKAVQFWRFPVQKLCRMSVRVLPTLFRVPVPLM